MRAMQLECELLITQLLLRFFFYFTQSSCFQRKNRCFSVADSERGDFVCFCGTQGTSDRKTLIIKIKTFSERYAFLHRPHCVICIR